MAVHASLWNSILQLDGALCILLLKSASALAFEGKLVFVTSTSNSKFYVPVGVRGLAGSVVYISEASSTPWGLNEGLAGF